VLLNVNLLACTVGARGKEKQQLAPADAYHMALPIAFEPSRHPVTHCCLADPSKLRGLLHRKKFSFCIRRRAKAEAMNALGTAPPDTGRPRKLAAYLDGFSLHAAVHLHANDR
jgi:hypothetical protein